MNFLIVSDSFMVRKSLSQVFKSVFESSDVKCVLKLQEIMAEDINYSDFIILDIRASNEKIIDAVKKINEFKKLKIVILDMKKNKSLFLNLVKLGIDGYILNITDEDDFIYIIKRIAKGKRFYDSELLHGNMDIKIKEYDKITKREQSVLNQICNGLTNKDIAKKLDVTEYTIKKHVSSILSKLHLKNRQDIIIFARDNELSYM
ncbi:MAG: response regulator transcription factor [Romboutsia sp.]